MNNDLLDDADANLINHRNMSLIAWWEQRRIYYNLSLFAAFGVAVFKNLHNASNIGWWDLSIWLLMYLTVANVCYTIGWASEFLKIYYRGEGESLIAHNKLWFWFVGTVLSGVYLFQTLEHYLENWAPSIFFQF